MPTGNSLVTGKLTSAENALWRTYPGYTNINQETNIATTSYNSLQAGIRQQSRHGLSFEIDYTYSHQIDDQLGSADLDTVDQPVQPKI